MNASADNQVIPEGELHCIWMDAGLVGYKLCDRELQCEECPFDALIRLQAVNQIAPPSSAGAQRTVQCSVSGEPQTSANLIEAILERTTGPLMRRPLMEDRLYHLNHTWVSNDRLESVTVGLDHIAAYLLHPIVGVVLPQPPTHVEQNAPCIWIVMHEGTIAIQSPLAGNIVRVNRHLRDHPDLIGTDPYHEGWVLHIAPSDLAHSLDQLRSSSRIAHHYSDDLTKLSTVVRQHLRRHFDTVGTTLPDGGQRLIDIHDILGASTYFDIVSTIIPGSH